MIKVHIFHVFNPRSERQFLHNLAESILVCLLIFSITYFMLPITWTCFFLITSCWIIINLLKLEVNDGSSASSLFFLYIPLLKPFIVDYFLWTLSLVDQQIDFLFILYVSFLFLFVIFFADSRGNPRCITNSKGRKRKPGSKSLSMVLCCSDSMFIDFVSKCLEWVLLQSSTSELKIFRINSNCWKRKNTFAKEKRFGAGLLVAKLLQKYYDCIETYWEFVLAFLEQISTIISLKFLHFLIAVNWNISFSH